jgi:hypothetical protein
MKTFETTVAQGDIYITRVDALPAGVVPVEPENGVVIVTHSETGHHHVMDADSVTMHRLPDSIMDCLLVVKEPTPLRHLRAHDTHEPIMFQPGVYNVRRQREYTPEGFRRVED